MNLADAADPGPAPSLGCRPVVLVAMGAFWPKSESTGPNISLIGLCRALSDEFEFRILARDRPFGAPAPLAQSGAWRDCDFASVRYCEIGPFGARDLAAILRETSHDILWLNGFFDREFTIPALIQRRLAHVPTKPTLLSPRGEFAGGALGLKSARKRAWLIASRLGRLLSSVRLHATGPREHDDIAAGCSWADGIVDAPNMRAMIDMPDHDAIAAAGEGSLRVVFVGRIARVKNLDYALNALRRVHARVLFEIFGPISEPDYWAECQALIVALPENVSVRYRGEIPNQAVQDAMAGVALFFLPTKGENFGHAIFEALACGVPVLISDQTPWRNLLENCAGWALPLGDLDRFAATIDALVDISDDWRRKLRAGARAMAENWIADSDAVAINRAMLRDLLTRGRRPPAKGMQARESAGGRV